MARQIMNSPFKVEQGKWWEKPRLMSNTRVRLAPHFNPINWSGVAGLTGLIIEIRNILGEGKTFKMIELGSFSGESSAMFAGSGIFEKLWLIDQWKNQACEGICEYNMNRFGEGVEMIKGDIDEIAKTWGEEVDCIYVDADHSYEAVKRNLEDWYPFLKSGGVMAGHDYYQEEKHPGVIRAVNEFFDHPIQTFCDSSWAIKKP